MVSNGPWLLTVSNCRVWVNNKSLVIFVLLHLIRQIQPFSTIWSVSDFIANPSLPFVHFFFVFSSRFHKQRIHWVNSYFKVLMTYFIIENANREFKAQKKNFQDKSFHSKKVKVWRNFFHRFISSFFADFNP